MRTIREVFEAMPAAFQKDAARGVNVTYQFDITGDEGGKWFAAIKDGELTVGEGERPDPDVLVTAAAPDYLAVSEGRLNGMLAYATGKLKVKGNVGLAMKMATFFKR